MNTSNLSYIDDLYLEYMEDPNSVPLEWQQYFRDYFESHGNGEATSQPVLPEVDPELVNRAGANSGSRMQRIMDLTAMQDRVDQLVRGYRVRGHLAAKFNPLFLPRDDEPELDLESYGLSDEDLKRNFSTRTINGSNTRSLREIVSQLQDTYCRTIGTQFMHIDALEVRDWLQQRMEANQNRLAISRKMQLRILTRLTDAVIFEKFMRTKFTGAKTFSLEGAESLIPLLDLALEKAGEHGVCAVVLGMAHRGRLNVLFNILGKRAQSIFWSFNDPAPELHRGGGDVRYHLGYSSDWTTTTGKKLHLSLCFNPSHLEYVNPVALGRLRCKQDGFGPGGQDGGLGILIHGDAAFAGEGVVQETLNLSQLPGYTNGGTLHIILNNQIGFTTPPEEGRSSTYASDVAKLLQIPIFHVNGEDPEAVAQVINLAMDFRRKFHRDVVIDMYCYRRWGHNEGDEPRFTQPRLYEVIDSRETVRDGYLNHLLKLDEVSQEEADEIEEQRRDHLEREFDLAQEETYHPDHQSLGGYWADYYGGPERTDDDLDTGVKKEMLSEIISRLTNLPKDFSLHPKLKRPFKQRKEMADSRPLDWASAEALAFGSLAMEGHRVRLTGQDCGRGTFSQRHAVLTDVKTGVHYTPLQHLASDQAPVEIINSPLSEAGVLGFEYGYSLDAPSALVGWEAQFGDFWNAAQVIVDQFISSAEDKWRRLSGLVMLLPHGFEGQGPEHCSARIERFLLLTAEHNIQVVQPTTPAQYFHVLRRQVKRKWRKPLVCLTPKSLLRSPMVKSDLSELISGRFQRILPDTEVTKAKKIIFCTGKVYYDILKERQDQEIDDVALIRLEQMYPFPEELLQKELEKYPAKLPVYWTQEEPANMGAWQFLRVRFGDTIYGRPLKRISRPESASPSTGSGAAHKLEQDELIVEALDR